MKFCNLCGSRLIPQTTQGTLNFKCERCTKSFPALPVDSLRSNIDYEAAESSEKYDVMEHNAPADTAGKKVKKQCPDCLLPYLTHIYVGGAQISKYVCECGYKTLSKLYNN